MDAFFSFFSSKKALQAKDLFQLRDPSIPIENKLYALFRHKDPSAVAELLLDEELLAMTKTDFPSPNGPPQRIPLSLLLALVLPLINSNETSKICGIVSGGIPLLSSLLEEHSNSYLSHLRLVLQSFLGNFEMFLEVVKSQIGNPKEVGLFGLNNLKGPPKLVSEAKDHISKVSTEMSKVLSVSDFLLWMSLANAFLTGKDGDLKISLLASSSVAPSQALNRDRENRVIEHLAAMIGLRDGPDNKWSSELDKLCTCIMTKLPKDEAIQLRSYVFNSLNSLTDEHVQQTFGEEHSIESVTGLSIKVLSPFFTARHPTQQVKDGRIFGNHATDLIAEYDRWWSMILKPPNPNSVLAVLFATNPETIRLWSIGRSFHIIFDMLMEKRRNADAKTEVNHLIVSMFNPVIFPRDPNSADWKYLLTQFGKSNLVEVLSMLDEPYVTNHVQENSAVKQFLSSCLPSLVDNYRSKDLLVLSRPNLLSNLSSECIIKMLPSETQRQLQALEVIKILFVAPWTSGVRVPIERISVDKGGALRSRMPSYYPETDLIDFFAFGFDSNNPFLTCDGGKPELGVVSWVWISALFLAEDLVIAGILRNERYLALFQESVKRVTNEGNVQNMLKYATLFDHLIFGAIHPKYPHSYGEKDIKKAVAQLALLLSQLVNCISNIGNENVSKIFEVESIQKRFFRYLAESELVIRDMLKATKDTVEIEGKTKATTKVWPRVIACQPLDKAKVFLDSKRAAVSVCSSDEAKSAFRHLETYFEEAGREIDIINAEVSVCLRRTEYLNQLQSDARRKIKNDNVVLKEIDRLQFSMSQLQKKATSEASLANKVSLRNACHEVESFFSGNNEVHTLLVSPILSREPYSKLFHEFLLQAILNNEANTDFQSLWSAALQNLDLFLDNPETDQESEFDQILAQLKANVELSLLDKLYQSRGEERCPEPVRNVLTAAHLSEIRKLARRLLRANSLEERDYGNEWISAEVQEVLESCDEDTIRTWKSITEIPSFVSAIRDVLQKLNPEAMQVQEPTQQDIEKLYEEAQQHYIQPVIERMRGLVGSDASYDVLVAFARFVPMLTVLLQTSKMPNLKLSVRLTMLSSAKILKVEPIGTSDSIVKMLNEQISDVRRIIEIQGSTSEAGRIKTELSLLQRDEKACLAICICPEGSTSHRSNVSVRLFITDPKNNNNVKVLYADEKLNEFEERVLMVGNEDMANDFSTAWNYVSGLLPQLSHAAWLGLKSRSIEIESSQRNILVALPIQPSDGSHAFYVFCTGVTENKHMKDATLTEKIASYINNQLQAQEEWLLIFPRRIANDILGQSKNQYISSATLSEAQHFLDPFSVPVDKNISFQHLKQLIASAPKYSESMKHKTGTRKPDIVRYLGGSDVYRVKENTSQNPIYFGQALKFAISKYKDAQPMPFELLFCTPQTLDHDVRRFVEIMKHFQGRRFTIIGTEALAAFVCQELFRGLDGLGSLVPEILILTGADEISFGHLKHEIVGCNVLGSEMVHKATLQKTKKEFNCSFITGDYLSGKSHYAKKKGAVPIPHTGDALDLAMTATFFNDLKSSNTDAGPSSTKVDPPKTAWIDLNSYMITPTPKDPYKLLKLNSLLWTLLQFRFILDDASGLFVSVSPSVHLIIEVPPQMMHCEDPSIIRLLEADHTLPLAACAHLGDVIQVDSWLASFDLTVEHEQVATALNLLLIPNREAHIQGPAIRMLQHDQGWNWEDTALRERGSARDVITKSIVKLMPYSQIVAESIEEKGIRLKSNGSFSSLLQLLHSRFKPLLQAYGVTGWMAEHTPAFLKSLEHIVAQTCERWAPNCEITREKLALKPVYLPSVDAFVTYPYTLSHQDAYLEKLCEGSKENRDNMLSILQSKPQFAPYNDETKRNIIDLCYVLTGEANEPDLDDLQKAFDAVGFVPVDDMLIRALHCVERQQGCSTLIIEGKTGVGKSFLISTLFRCQLQYAIRRANDIVTCFLKEEIFRVDYQNDQSALKEQVKAYCGQEPLPVLSADSQSDNQFTIWHSRTMNAQCVAFLYGSEKELLSNLARVFEAKSDVDGFYRRFDKMKKNLADYPGLVWPSEMPSCMTVEPRTFSDRAAMMLFWKTLLLTPLDYEFKMVAHPDTKREEILALLKKPVALAAALKQSKDSRVNKLVVPVFIDENNTLIETAGLIKTIMVDRRNPLDEQQGGHLGNINIWFVGAINRKSSDYKTQELHPSLEPSVSHFSGIKEPNQRLQYIKQTLQRCSNAVSGAELASFNSQLSELILEMHNMSEAMCSPQEATEKAATTNQKQHVVSQREFHKVESLIRTISLLLDEVNKEVVGDRTLAYVWICLTTVYYVYVARIRSEESRSSLKSMMDKLCKVKYEAISKFFLAVDTESVSEYARQKIIEIVISRKTIDLKSGIALTNTLKENVFLTLLACTSRDKHKICLAIIGDSGMGKTLSNRVVERNLKGTNSLTQFCSNLPHSRFFYIQGATTTTSEQVSLVCDRAQQDQEKNQGS